MKKIILNKFFKRFVCFFLIFSILFLSCFRLYAKPQKAEAFAPALIGLGVAVAFGLVTLGIAVTNTDVSNPGSDKTNALAYACDFWEQKKQEAIAKGLVTAFEVNQWLYNAGAGLYDTTSVCYDWIKEAVHNIYNNLSFFQSSANSFQVGNLNNASNCLYLSLSNPLIKNGSSIISDSYSFSKFGYDYFTVNGIINYCLVRFSGSSLYYYYVSDTPFTYSKSSGSMSADSFSYLDKTYYFFAVQCLSFSSGTKVSTNINDNVYNFLSLNTVDYDNLYHCIYDAINNITSAGTGISAQTNQSAKNLYTGADTNESAAERILKGDTYVSYNIGSSSGSASSGVGLGNDVIGSKSGVISCPTTPDDISITLKKLIEGEKSLADVLADAQATPYVVGKIDSKTGVLNPTADPSIAANPSIADGVTTATLDVSTGELIEEKDETTGKPKYKPFIPSNNPGSGIGFSKLLANFLYKTFPFCLPFDIYSVLCVFTGGSSGGYNTFSSGGLVRAPVITLDLSFFENFFKYYGYSGSSKSSTSSELVSSDSYDITIDFSPFDRAASLFRALWEVLFVILLSKNAKKLIHGGDG